MDLFLYDLKIRFFHFQSPPPFFKKQGLYLEWKNEFGTELISDVCLLGGFNQETYTDVLAQIDLLQKKQIDPSELLPSLHFALNHPLEKGAKIAPQKYQGLIHKNTLIKDPHKIPLFDTLKIKIKDFSTKELIDLMLELSKTHKIRLDANRYHLDQTLIEFLKEYEHIYEYIEEPIFHQKDIDCLKIALDETIYLNEPFPNFLNIKAIIYKPTLCGGISRIKQHLNQYPVIMSSCYESTIGIKRIIQLHQQLFNAPLMAIGIDTIPIEDPFKLLDKKPPYVLSVENNVFL